MENLEVKTDKLPTPENFPPKEGETEISYVNRFSDEIFSARYVQKTASREEAGVAIDNFYHYLIENPLPVSEERRGEFVTEIELEPEEGKIINFFASLPREMVLNERQYFDHPEIMTTRPFWGDSEECYATRLFGIAPWTQHNPMPRAILEYVKSRLDGKRILNIGGGRSLHDLTVDNSISIDPDILVNLDPFLSRESVDINQKGFYRSVNISGTDPNITDMLKQNACPDSYDEIWALFSLPAYVEGNEDLGVFFDNVKKLLAEKGTARIFPISIAITHDGMRTISDMKKHDMLKKELISLAANKGFTAALFGTPADDDRGLLFQKVRE